MRLMCVMSGGCRWTVVKEEWVNPTKDRPYSLMIRFSECGYCGDTRGTQTSPKDTETFFSIPDKYSVVAGVT